MFFSLFTVWTVVLMRDGAVIRSSLSMKEQCKEMFNLILTVLASPEVHKTAIS